MSDLEQIAVEHLPSDWQIRPLGEFCDFMGGTQPPKSTFVYEPREGYVRLLQIRDFETDSKATYIPVNSRLRSIKADDISIARYGASVGRILTGKVGAINVAIMTTLPNTSVVNKGFFYYALKHPAFYRYLTGLGGRAAQAGFNKGEVSRFRFPLPPLPEQKKIAHILSTVQRAIEAQERIIQTTTELKKALMHKLFTEGLRNEPQKQTEIGPVPESWEVKKIGEVADLKSGGTPSRKKPEYWAGGAIPWIKTGEVDYCIITDTEEKITKDGLEQSSAKLFPAGTLIMAMYGQGITRGKVAMLGIEASTNQACVAFFPSQEVDSRFLYFFFENSYDGIRSFAHGANQKNLSSEIIKTFPVSYPKDKEEQKEITDTLDELDNKILIHQKKKEVYQDLFRTLLHELMTAETRVTGISFPQPPERT
jgi:type I restriction enzyme S subunit